MIAAYGTVQSTQIQIRVTAGFPFQPRFKFLDECYLANAAWCTKQNCSVLRDHFRCTELDRWFVAAKVVLERAQVVRGFVFVAEGHYPWQISDGVPYRPERRVIEEDLPERFI